MTHDGNLVIRYMMFNFLRFVSSKYRLPSNNMVLNKMSLVKGIV